MTSGAPIKAVLFGASGRMGREIVSAAGREGGFQFIGGVAAPDDSELGKQLPGIETPLVSAWQPEFDGADVIIDFSSRAGTILALEAAYQHRVPLLVGTTGLGEELDMIFGKVATAVPVVRASNTSVGINLLLKLAQESARVLESSDVEIVEAHHRMKKDAPSGTALTLAEGIREARGGGTEIKTGRSGAEAKRAAGEIGVHAVRGGNIFGDHSVFFIGDGETIELTHRVASRSVFAEGALRAARWLARKAKEKNSAALYSMSDVLG